jgi:hypothetical protein
MGFRRWNVSVCILLGDSSYGSDTKEVRMLLLISYHTDSCSANSGLGRHFFYLTNLERNQAMRWDFASQPVGKTIQNGIGRS